MEISYHDDWQILLLSIKSIKLYLYALKAYLIYVPLTLYIDLPFPVFSCVP